MRSKIDARLESRISSRARDPRTDIPYRALSNPSWFYRLWETCVSNEFRREHRLVPFFDYAVTSLSSFASCMRNADSSSRQRMSRRNVSSWTRPITGMGRRRKAAAIAWTDPPLRRARGCTRYPRSGSCEWEARHSDLTLTIRDAHVATRSKAAERGGNSRSAAARISAIGLVKYLRTGSRSVSRSGSP